MSTSTHTTSTSTTTSTTTRREITTARTIATTPMFTEDSTWWSWFKNVFSGIKTIAQFLAYSVYLLTIYDIINGILTILNSCYILYKICEKVDNRRPGETRFRVAVARLFGRGRRTRSMSTQVPIEPEMPLQLMPTAPSMRQICQTPVHSTPSTPRVHSISTHNYSTQPNVRSRTPVRRTQIVEEYARSSSEETMPLNTLVPYRTVRVNEIPEVRSIKRRAPQAPKMYFSDHGPPLYLDDSDME